jgi:hypothetical protein
LELAQGLSVPPGRRNPAGKRPNGLSSIREPGFRLAEPLGQEFAGPFDASIAQKIAAETAKKISIFVFAFFRIYAIVYLFQS